MLVVFAIVKFASKERFTSRITGSGSNDLQPLTTLLIDSKTPDDQERKEKSQKFALFMDFVNNIKQLKEYNFAKIKTSQTDIPI